LRVRFIVTLGDGNSYLGERRTEMTRNKLVWFT